VGGGLADTEGEEVFQLLPLLVSPSKEYKREATGASS